MSEWTFSLRKGRAYNYDSDASEEDVPPSFSAPGWTSQSADKEETVQFQESPWTIAKVNAASRIKDNAVPNASDTPSSSHQLAASTQNAPNRPVAKKQITIETALQQQSERPSAVIHTKATMKKVLSKNSDILSAFPSLQFSRPTNLATSSIASNDLTATKPLSPHSIISNVDESCVKSHQNARQFIRSFGSDITFDPPVRTTNRTPSSFPPPAVTSSLRDSDASNLIQEMQPHTSHCLTPGKSLKRLLSA